MHLDWGPIPGSYGWVFPKGDTLTVGVIAARGAGEETRDYLRDFVGWLGLERHRVVHDSGHLTRCRTPDSPLGRGRVLLAGDAAGLLEPWTREGISFATRSGALAGAVAAAGATGAVERYRAALAVDLLPEMAAGERCLRAFEARPWAFHELIRSTPVGWRQFCRITRGETTLARAPYAARRCAPGWVCSASGRPASSSARRLSPAACRAESLGHALRPGEPHQRTGELLDRVVRRRPARLLAQPLVPGAADQAELRGQPLVDVGEAGGGHRPVSWPAARSR